MQRTLAGQAEILSQYPAKTQRKVIKELQALFGNGIAVDMIMDAAPYWHEMAVSQNFKVMVVHNYLRNCLIVKVQPRSKLGSDRLPLVNFLLSNLPVSATRYVVVRHGDQYRLMEEYVRVFFRTSYQPIIFFHDVGYADSVLFKVA